MKKDKKNFIDDLERIKISEIELARNAIGKLPDIREDKVKELKEKYNNPDYEIDCYEVADKMIKDIIG